MEKYKIKDLLLIYEFGDCRFGVLNNKKTKIKILTKNEIHSLHNPSLHTYMKEDRDVGHFYYVNVYETKDGLKAFPLCGKFEDINANSRAIFRDDDDTCFYRYKQITQVLEYNRMDNSKNIFEAVFNNPENFIDITTIAKIEKAVNFVESYSKSAFRNIKNERLAKQKCKNQEYAKQYDQTLEFWKTPTNIGGYFYCTFYSKCQQIVFFMLCLSTLRQIPTADMNTTRDVEPAEINGSGRPVGGIRPETTQTFKMTWIEITLATPKTKSAPNLSFAFLAMLINKYISTAKTIKVKIAPKSPNSSPIIEKIKSLSENGKNIYFCLEFPNPTPKSPPEPREYNDWISWNPSAWGLAHGFKKAINLWIL